MRRTTKSAALLAFAALPLALACSKGDPGPAGPPGPNASAPPAGSASNTTSDLVVTPTAARVTGDNHLQVDFKLTDAAGNPSPSTGVASSWTAAVLGTDATSGLPAWQALVVNPTAVTGPAGTTNQPTSDTKGTLEDQGNGNFRYTYASTLPAGYDKAATYRVGVWAQRPLPGIAQPAEAPDYDVANGVLDFVPGGGTPQPQDLVSAGACNACHGILGAHGGFRRDPRLCTTCHTTQLFDPDTHDTGDPSQMNPLDLGRLVHRVHSGRDLPTVLAAATAAAKSPGDASLTGYAYHVIGFRNSDNVYGAVAKNPDPTAAAATPFVTTGVGLPQDLRNCAMCHAQTKDASGNVTGGAQANMWQTRVSRRTCQSCHDSSWFADASPPALHVLHQQATNPGNASVAGLPQPDDTKCTGCHSTTLMQQHHQAPVLSSDFKPIVAKITSATSSGTQVTVAFTLAEKDGTPIDAKTLSSASVVVGGPTAEYVAANQSSTSIIPSGTAAGATATGPGAYTLTIPLAAGAKAGDTWAAGIEARRSNATLTAREKKLDPTAGTVNDFADNPVAYFVVGGGTAKPVTRRKVVTEQTCNGCHNPLSAHGDLRHNPEYCVICHAPDATDKALRTAAPVDKLDRRDIHFKPFIHSLHTGEELQVQQPFVIYGFRSSVNFLNETRFPGNMPGTGRARCTQCHAPGASNAATFTVDAIPASAATTTGMQWTPSTFDPSTGFVTAGGEVRDGVPPITATCASCHDTTQARAHMEQQSPAASWPAETCAVCHGEGSLAAVTDVHLRFTR